MASTYKVLGQSNPVAATDTTLYAVPAATSAIVSSLTVCNQGVAATFRVAVRPAGATLVAMHYVTYDAALGATDTVALTLGISLGATDVVTVYASTTTVSFSLFGCELS